MLRTIALNWTRFFAVRLYRKRWLGRKARPLVHKKWCRHTVAENDQQLFKTLFGKNQINRYFRGKASQNSLAVRSLRHELEKELLLEMYIFILSPVFLLCFFGTSLGLGSNEISRTSQSGLDFLVVVEYGSNAGRFQSDALKLKKNPLNWFNIHPLAILAYLLEK